MRGRHWILRRSGTTMRCATGTSRRWKRNGSTGVIVLVSAPTDPVHLGIQFATELFCRGSNKRAGSTQEECCTSDIGPDLFCSQAFFARFALNRTNSCHLRLWSAACREMSAPPDVAVRRAEQAKKRVPMLRAPLVSHSTHDSHSRERSSNICSWLYKTIRRNTHDFSSSCA